MFKAPNEALRLRVTMTTVPGGIKNRFDDVSSDGIFGKIERNAGFWDKKGKT